MPTTLEKECRAGILDQSNGQRAFSARSPPRRQNSAVGALAFIWRTTSSNHGRQASSRACRSFTAMNVKSSWAGASAPCRRPGQTPSDKRAGRETEPLAASNRVYACVNRETQRYRARDRRGVRRLRPIGCKSGVLHAWVMPRAPGGQMTRPKL